MKKGVAAFTSAQGDSHIDAAANTAQHFDDGQ
jgi:hypothetical protein